MNYVSSYVYVLVVSDLFVRDPHESLRGDHEDSGDHEESVVWEEKTSFGSLTILTKIIVLTQTVLVPLRGMTKTSQTSVGLRWNTSVFGVLKSDV